MERLADKVQHPKPFKDYKDGLAQLTRWESDCRVLEKLEGQPLSNLTKPTTLKSMLPADLLRNLERDRGLKTYAEAWEFILDQVPLRKDWRSSGNKGRDDMDVDAAEQEPPEDCPVCERTSGGDDDKLNTMKGGASKGGAG